MDLCVKNNQLGILHSSVGMFTEAPLFKETKYGVLWDEVGFSVPSYTAGCVNCYWNIHRIAWFDLMQLVHIFRIK